MSADLRQSRKAHSDDRASLLRDLGELEQDLRAVRTIAEGLGLDIASVRRLSAQCVRHYISLADTTGARRPRTAIDGTRPTRCRACSPCSASSRPASPARPTSAPISPIRRRTWRSSCGPSASCASPRPRSYADATSATSTRATLARYGLPTPAAAPSDGRRRSRRTLKAVAHAVVATVRMRSVIHLGGAALTVSTAPWRDLGVPRSRRRPACARRTRKRADDLGLRDLLLALLYSSSCLALAPDRSSASLRLGRAITRYLTVAKALSIGAGRHLLLLIWSARSSQDRRWIRCRLARPIATMPSPRVRAEAASPLGFDIDSAPTATSPRPPTHRNRSSVSRSALACTACRRVKLRCTTQGNSVRGQCRLDRLTPAQTICTRCISHGLECLFEPVRGVVGVRS